MNKETANSAGWHADLNSVMMGMGTQMVSKGPLGFLASEESLSDLGPAKPEYVSTAYWPCDQSTIDQVYSAVGPSDLLRMQQTTMIYLTQNIYN